MCTCALFGEVCRTAVSRAPSVSAALSDKVFGELGSNAKRNERKTSGKYRLLFSGLD